MSSVFVSYRRSDSTPYAVSLAEALRQALGNMNVFLDTTGISIGEVFPNRLRRELEGARACIIVIGPDWLRAPDQDGRRRIDDATDWVHQEVRFALEREVAVPVLVHGATLPAASALPEPLKALATTNAATLRDDHQVQDLRRFVAEFCERFDFPLVKPDILWPQPDKRAQALGEDEIKTWIASRRSAGAEAKSPSGSSWSLVPWIREGESEDGICLLRSYRFRTFEDAVHFMSTAARFITRTEHHPAWTNIWRTVTVRLTTFDIGHKPSVYDQRLAEYLDDLYREYQPDGPGARASPSGPQA
jgi:pterin-4a-carbinolamine dehydratase